MTEKRNFVRGVAREEKIPIIYQRTADGKYEGYYEKDDKSRVFVFDKDEYDRYKSLTTEFILIEKDNKYDPQELKETWEEFMRDAILMKERTNGAINMFKTGRNAQTALYFAFKFLREKKIEAEPVTYEEYKWFEDCNGQLVWGEPYEGKIWKYDINSSYPSIYSSGLFLIPFRCGEFKHLTKEEFDEMKMKFFAIGIYRAKVSFPDDNPKWRKVFRLNAKDTYTHIDLNWALKIGLNIDYVDREKNFLHYSRDKCMRGNELFKEFTETLYTLKKDPVLKRRSKGILNSLWGALVQSNVTKIIVKHDEEYEPYEGKEIVEIESTGNGHKITVMRKNKPYDTEWARLKPFLFSKGKVKIAEYIWPNHENIHRCHTDSMLSDVELKIKLGDGIGMMKLEEGGIEMEIVNAMKAVKK